MHVTESEARGRAPDDRHPVAPVAADAYVGRRTPRRAAMRAATGSLGGVHAHVHVARHGRTLAP